MLLFSFCLLYLIHISECAELLMAQAVFRHGARAPIEKVTSSEAENHFFRGKGQLTDEGIAQAETLGTALKYRLVDSGFLDRRMKPSEILFSSSASERCLMTSAAVGSAMFKNGTRNIFVPVATQDKDHDFLCYIQTCEPLYVEMGQALALNRTLANLSDVISTKSEEMSEKSTYFNVKERSDVVEQLVIERKQGLAVPSWFNATAEAEAEKILFHALSFATGTGPYRHNNWMTARSGFMLHNIFQNFQDAIDCNTRNVSCQEVKKFYSYSTHDLMIMTLLESLDILQAALGNDTLPQYTSCVLMELWKDNGDYFLKILYRDLGNASFMSLTPHVPVCRDTELCAFSTFHEQYAKFGTSQPFCRGTTSSGSRFSLTVICFIVILDRFMGLF